MKLVLMAGAFILSITMQAEARTKMIACPLAEGGVVYVGESSKSKSGYAIAFRPEGTGVWNTDAKNVVIDNAADLGTLRAATLANLFASGFDCRLEIQALGKRNGASFTCSDRPDRSMAATCEFQQASRGE